MPPSVAATDVTEPVVVEMAAVFAEDAAESQFHVALDRSCAAGRSAAYLWGSREYGVGMSGMKLSGSRI